MIIYHGRQTILTTAEENKFQSIFSVENIPIWLGRSDKGDIRDGHLGKN